MPTHATRASRPTKQALAIATWAREAATIFGTFVGCGWKPHASFTVPQHVASPFFFTAHIRSFCIETNVASVTGSRFHASLLWMHAISPEARSTHIFPIVPVSCTIRGDLPAREAHAASSRRARVDRLRA